MPGIKDTERGKPEEAIPLTCVVSKIIGNSDQSFDRALSNALDNAKRIYKNVTGLDVVGHKAKVRHGEITVYRVVVEVAHDQ